jgi:O-antigen ligase
MSYLLAIIIFLIPSNLFLKIGESSAYTNGLFIDYLIPKFYISDIFILLLLGWWIIKKTNIKNKKFGLTLAIISTLLIRQFFTTNQPAAVWFFFKLTEISIFYLFLSRNKELLKNKIVTLSVTATIIFQSLLAVYQYHFQHSLLGYPLLGEPSIPQAIGLATNVVNGVEKIAPYGTTAHPNILGGILCILMLFLIKSFAEKKPTIQSFKVIAILLGMYALLITGSMSAIISFLLSIAAIAFSKKINPKIALFVATILFIAIPFGIHIAAHQYPQSTSLSRRQELQQKSFDMFLAHPLTGVGLNQFTTQTINFNQSRELVRFVQPVHHIGLLWLAETGLLGAVILILLLKKTDLKKYAMALLILTPIAALDHYLLTQQTGLLLAAFTLVFFNKIFSTR